MAASPWCGPGPWLYIPVSAEPLTFLTASLCFLGDALSFNFACFREHGKIWKSLQEKRWRGPVAYRAANVDLIQQGKVCITNLNFFSIEYLWCRFVYMEICRSRIKSLHVEIGALCKYSVIVLKKYFIFTTSCIFKWSYIVCINKKQAVWADLFWCHVGVNSTRKRQFAPRFMDTSHGSTSNRSANGYFADVSTVATIFLQQAFFVHFFHLYFTVYALFVRLTVWTVTWLLD